MEKSRFQVHNLLVTLRVIFVFKAKSLVFGIPMAYHAPVKSRRATRYPSVSFGLNALILKKLGFWERER
jgi:hypothetical protein